MSFMASLQLATLGFVLDGYWRGRESGPNIHRLTSHKTRANVPQTKSGLDNHLNDGRPLSHVGPFPFLLVLPKLLLFEESRSYFSGSECHRDFSPTTTEAQVGSLESGH